MTDTQRYSDKRKTEAFTIYVLLSEALQFNVSEIYAALREDYPGIDWQENQMGDSQVDTAQVSLATDFVDSGMVSFTTTPGRCDVAWGDIFEKNRLTYPDAEAMVARHQSYLAINVHSPRGETSLAARFDAARRLTCIGAVFAKLPITMGIYFPNGDTIVKPADWVRAADEAMAGEVPVLQWMTLAVVPVPDGTDMPTPISVQSIGMAAFNGYEILMPLARMPAGEVAQWVHATVKMIMERGHIFTDSDTLGIEGDTKKIRIRHAPEGKMGAQTDMWVLLHPTSTINETEMFGERSRPPAPPGIKNEIMGDENALKNSLYGYIAGRD
jgi:hypothetical protein